MFLHKVELEGTKKKKGLVVFHFSKALLFLSKETSIFLMKCQSDLYQPVNHHMLLVVRKSLEFI